MKKRELSGKLKIIKQLAKTEKFSLDVGSKNVRFGDVNIDIDRSCSPDVVADAKCLPFRSCLFKLVFFSDVIEHLPMGHEPKILREIHRVMRLSSELILTTPHRRLLFLILDPAWYFIRHRHYKISEIESLLKTNGFGVKIIFTSGSFWTCMNVLWYCFITYPLKRLFGLSLPYCPNILKTLEDQEYNKHSQNGYTIFVKARKLSKDDF